MSLQRYLLPGGRRPLLQRYMTPGEAKKMFPLSFMLFMVIFNYTILKDTKDVTESGRGLSEVGS